MEGGKEGEGDLVVDRLGGIIGSERGERQLEEGREGGL
jgi:hypothetical protein